jgi:hypothetical protein
MFQDEMKNVLLQVLTSWQVIAATVVLVLYVFLITYVAKLYHRPRIRIGSRKPKKQKAAPVAASAESEGSSEEDVNDELGLEEE